MQITHGGYFQFLFNPGVRYSLFLVYAYIQQFFTKNKKNKKREPV